MRVWVQTTQADNEDDESLRSQQQQPEKNNNLLFINQLCFIVFVCRGFFRYKVAVNYGTKYRTVLSRLECYLRDAVTGDIGWKDAEGNLFLSCRPNSVIRYRQFQVCYAWKINVDA